MIKPFKADIPQEILNDLKLRIRNTRWPDEITDSGWNYGTNLSYMKELADYWVNTFDWRKIEKEINSYPNFTADIDGYKIHFLHVKGKGKKSIPLIITHGWPGSFIEMMKLIPLLTNDERLSFDLVIPSVIGFGFSGKVTQPGCNSAVVADLWNKLMIELGYKEYGAQGGDIGSGISTWLSLNHPENVLGLHLNYIAGSYKPFLNENEQLSEEVQAFQQYAKTWSSKEGAYAQQHSSKPITLAYGLNDSPIGLCAWIIEKFNGWSDNKGNIENVFSKDELDLVMVLKKPAVSAVAISPAVATKKKTDMVAAKAALVGAGNDGGGDNLIPPEPDPNVQPPANSDPAGPDPNAPVADDNEDEIQEDPLPSSANIPIDQGPTPTQRFKVPDSNEWDWLSPMLDAGLNAVWNIPVGFVYANSKKETNDILGLVGNLLFNVSGMIAPICAWGQGPVKWAGIIAADVCNLGYGAMSAAISLDNQPVDS